jgi:hypothetical protein
LTVRAGPLVPSVKNFVRRTGEGSFARLVLPFFLSNLAPPPTAFEPKPLDDEVLCAVDEAELRLVLPSQPDFMRPSDPAFTTSAVSVPE